jgi:GNAT superfamily N-acetyltransferase
MFQIEVMKKDAFSQFRERIEILLAAKARKPEAKLIAEAFGDPNNIICGGFDRGVLVGVGIGHVGVHFTGKKFFMSDLLVTTAAGKNGLGSKLIEAVEAEADRRGCQNINAQNSGIESRAPGFTNVSLSVCGNGDW